jgi:hypothetical protein
MSLSIQPIASCVASWQEMLVGLKLKLLLQVHPPE